MINLWWWWPWGRSGVIPPTPPVWPAICRTSVIGPTGPIHSVSAVEVEHSVTDGSPIHSVTLACE